MSKPPETATSEIVVHLVRPGDPLRTYHLSKGATLADFLSLIGTSSTDEKVYVQGVPIEEASPLNDGTVVTIVPQSWNGRGDEPWRGVITAFQDEALFEEYMEIIRAQRREDHSEEDLGVIIVDTDALSHMQKRDSVGLLIESWLNTSPDRESRITSVTAFEMLSGAVALVARQKQHRDVIPAFFLLEELIKYLATWKEKILSYDAEAERVYKGFPPRLRQELKDDARIAAVALVNGAAIWTCNVSDYSRVPGLILFDARTGSEVS